jgi:hypothetical protein
MHNDKNGYRQKPVPAWRGRMCPGKAGDICLTCNLRLFPTRGGDGGQKDCNGVNGF